jgi:hypothetical protein
MTSIREAVRRMFSPVEPIPPGVYHYQAPVEDPLNYHLHLRVEPDGSGILIVNAATLLHLNKTAVEYAYHLVRQTPRDQLVQSIASRYRVTKEQAARDYQAFVDQVETLIANPDLDPVMFLDFERQLPYSGDISAPYRLDCALTYRLPESADPQYAPVVRVSRELSTAEWQTILDKSWDAGIPHAVFTGGEPTLREDLPVLIKHGQAIGQVTGLITDGIRLSDSNYLNDLLLTGLDHLMINLDPKNEQVWQAIREAASDEIFTAVHITITAENQQAIPEFIDRLASLGINGISLSTNSVELTSEFQAVRDLVASKQIPLVWDLPVPYSALNPVALEVEGLDLPAGAGRAWLYVEPDGDVLPAQGYNHVLGNLLTDPWEKIWSEAKTVPSD